MKQRRLIIHFSLTLIITCCFCLTPVCAQELTTATASSWSNSAFAQQNPLPLPLQALPPSTSFFLFMNDADRFREKFTERVTQLLERDEDSAKWRAAGQGPALQWASELLGMSIPAAFNTFTGHFVVGRTTPGQWYLVADRPMGDEARNEALDRLFDNSGLNFKINQNACLIGAPSLKTRAAVWAMLAFNKSLPTEQVAVRAFQGMELADQADDIYRFWLRLPAKAGVAGSGSQLWGRGRWSDGGINHRAELVAAKTSGTLDALFANDNGAFRSFAQLPPKPLTVFAARFRTSSAVYQAVSGWASAPPQLKNIIARLDELAATARVNLSSGLFAHLGGEWAFATLAGQGKSAPWLLLMEVDDSTLVDLFVERFAQGLGSRLAPQQTYGSLNGRIFIVENRFTEAVRSYHVCRLGNFLAISNSQNAMLAALAAHQGASSFASSPLFDQAQQRLAAQGVAYSFHHSLACLTQLADQATLMNMEEPGFLTYSSGPMNLPLLEQFNLRSPDVYANTKFWGCAQLRRSPRGLTLEAHSTTGFGPLEMTAATMFGPLLEADYYARMQRTQVAMRNYAIALKEYWGRTRMLPQINYRNRRVERSVQLNLPPGAEIDPYTKAGRSFLVFIKEERFVVISRGPDRDLDHELDSSFDPWSKYRMQNGDGQLIWKEQNTDFDGDFILFGRFQKF